MASTLSPRQFAAAQESLRAAISDRLAREIARVEADRGARLDELDQEALASGLVMEAIDAHSRACLDQGRPVPTPEEEDRLGRAVLDDLLTASSQLQVYLTDPTVMSVRANDYRTTWVTYIDGRKERGPALAADDGGLIQIIRGLAEEAFRADGIERRFDSGSPRLDCALPNGDRVFAVMAVSRPMLVIRRHN
ncbi:MAG: CpaF family protein, partial [Actinomycetes bacterium]